MQSPSMELESIPGNDARNACKYTNVYNRGKNGDFKIVDTHLAFLKRKNRKERIKEYS